MKQLDLNSNSRIRDIREMLLAVSSVNDPQELQIEFGKRMRRFNKVDNYVSISCRGLDAGEYKITRMMLTADELDTNTSNPWKDWERIPTHTGGWIGEMIASPEPKIFNEFNLRGDPVLGDQLSHMGSAMIAPLFDQGEALNWSLMMRAEPDAFVPADVEEFLMRGNLVGRMTRNLVIQGEIEQLNARLQAQLDEISHIQQSLLPERLPKIPGLSLAASYLTSNEAGGDYYDFFPLDDSRWGFCIADVSGHGAGAATVVAMMHGILHGFEGRHRGPAAIATHLNRQLAIKRIESNFVTGLFGSWEPGSRELVIANAGHHLPSRRLASGKVEQLEGSSDIPLGIMEDVRYEQTTTRLDGKETLLLYTDGITEAFSPPPEREMFGLDRLHASLEDCSGHPECVIGSIHEGLFEHTGERTRDDDQTIVAMRVEE